ncbi:MAG: CBS domain-containing protein [Rhodospirillaceae bacterium]
MNAQIVPDVVDQQTIFSLTPDAIVKDAAAMMAEKKVAAMMVVEDDKLIGIMTERDITVRLVAKGLNAAKTQVKDIMTPDPDCLQPSDDAKLALTMMRERGYRHLPVVDGETVVGMVSIRDLYGLALDTLESEVKHHEAFIFGESYGAA